MNTNRIIQRIVNRIAKKRIAMELERANKDVFHVIDFAMEDPDSELFVYDVILTQDVFRKKYAPDGHEGMVEKIYNDNKEKAKQFNMTQYENLYDKVIRGYWLPERSEMYFHPRIARTPVGIKYVNPDYEQITKILSTLGADPEGMFVL